MPYICEIWMKTNENKARFRGSNSGAFFSIHLIEWHTPICQNPAALILRPLQREFLVFMTWFWLQGSHYSLSMQFLSQEWHCMSHPLLQKTHMSLVKKEWVCTNQNRVRDTAPICRLLVQLQKLLNVHLKTCDVSLKLFFT